MGEAARDERHLRAVPSADRIPPHNLEAEQALLGSMFLSVEATEGALIAVRAEDFSRPAHAKIYNAIAHLHERSIPVDHLSVADRLSATGELEAVGGKPYLLDITGVVPTTAHWKRYADIVSRTSLLRQLIGAGTEIVSLGYDAPDELTEIVSDAEKIVFDVTNKRVSSNFKGMSELLESSFSSLEDMYNNRGALPGVTSGFKDLDNLLAGFHPGDLLILAARPAVGKTALALNMAANAAKAGTSVAMFSLEMSAEQLVQRVLCSDAAVSMQDVRTGHVRDQDWRSLMNAANRLSELDFWVDDTPAISILEIRAKARRQLRNKDKGLIIVDYLQLMQPQHRRSENRQVEIAEISRGLKVLAKELHVPIIALSQLSRAVENRAGKRPQLSDLRESGAIEQDADVVMFIDRNTDKGGEQDEDRPAPGTAEIIVAKHRNGPTGNVKLVFNERYTKFINFSGHQP